MNRRHFLKNIIATGTAPCWIPSSCFGAESSVAASNQINVACVGLGGIICLLYTSPSPRDGLLSRMPSSA